MSKSKALLERRQSNSAALPLPDLSAELGASVLLTGDLSATSKEEALRRMTELLADAGFLHDTEVVAAAVLERERMAPTALVPGVAVPHCRSEMVGRLVVLLALLTSPVPFAPPAGLPVDRIFLVLAPHGATTQYLEVLAKIARLVRDGRWPESIFGAAVASGSSPRKRSPARRTKHDG